MIPKQDSSPVFFFPDVNDYKRLRDLLHQAGFLDAGVLQTLGLTDLPSVENDHPLLLDRTGSGSPLHTLIRLFLMELEVEAAILRQAIRPMTIESWQQAGLIRRHGEKVSAAVKLLPFQNLVLAFDLPAMLRSGQRQQYVMGIGGSTITLANLTIRKHSRQTLDLGCGCGVHAFLAAPHSDRTVAVDINPRALRLAEFNAGLNNIANLDCRQGNFFDPVAHEKFDLIISNPPFVISPETRFIYRDGGMEADSVCRQIVHEAPRLLNQGGFCQILCNWAQKNGEYWQKEMEEWFEGSGCDVWVMRSESLSAAAYASKWIRHTELDDRDMDFPHRFHHWMAYYEKLGIESFGAGLITMRKADKQKNWFRADESPANMLGQCGASVEQGFLLRDFLETVGDDDALLNTSLRHSPDLRLEQQFEPSGQGWKVKSSLIHLTKGLAYKGNSDTVIANLMIHCDGRKKLRNLVKDMAAAMGTSAPQVTPFACQLIRKLIEQGFLLPAEQKMK
ncbi:MAG: methyltransferase [Deltaproteobacteria bacterium]|nr:methyltransferase [Deltaproteobacteria bacterium]